MNLTINDDPIDSPVDASTFGDVLDWLETRHLKPGQCITRVTLDGTEELNYRSPVVCDRGIDTIGKVDVESGDFDRVLLESFEELEVELNHAMSLIAAVVERFETRDVDGAHQQLMRLLESLRSLCTVFSEDLGWVYATADKTPDVWGPAIAKALTELVSAQENGIWVSICDVLEYEIQPVLENWKAVVQGTRARIN